MGKFQVLGNRVGKLVDEKNEKYGNSFDEAGEFLKLLYPNGMTPDQYNDALCLVRVFDKMKRIATDKDAFGESPYEDMVGYSLLGLRRVESERKNGIEISQEVAVRAKEEEEHYAKLAAEIQEKCSGPHSRRYEDEEKEGDCKGHSRRFEDQEDRRNGPVVERRKDFYTTTKRKGDATVLPSVGGTMLNNK